MHRMMSTFAAVAADVAHPQALINRIFSFSDEAEAAERL